MGGHSVSFLGGSLWALILQPSLYCAIMIYSLAAGPSIFSMVVVDAGCPPAGATALGLAIMG